MMFHWKWIIKKRLLFEVLLAVQGHHKKAAPSWQGSSRRNEIGSDER